NNYIFRIFGHIRHILKLSFKIFKLTEKEGKKMRNLLLALSIALALGACGGGQKAEEQKPAEQTQQQTTTTTDTTQKTTTDTTKKTEQTQTSGEKK
ncbi:MAG: hypothetical protein ABIL76_08390, partial [candidate division WOR-3 bacterium]